MPPALLAALAASALLAVGADAVEEPACRSGESCASEGDELSLIQGQRLLSRRSAPMPDSGPFSSRKSCRRVAGGLVQCFPDIMLVGASQAGTSSVAAALKSHPSVDTQTPSKGPGATQEPGGELHILDTAYYGFQVHPSLSGYNLAIQRHWATAPAVSESRAGHTLQFQYAPSYMYFPDAPFNAHEVYLNVNSIKYLFMVRDPTKRAVSAWKLQRQSSVDDRSFETAMRQGMEQRRNLEACIKQWLHTRSDYSTAEHLEDLHPLEAQNDAIISCYKGKNSTLDRHTRSSTQLAHVDQGIYVDQLRRWFRSVGSQNCFVFSHEEWAANETDVFMQIANFTGLQAFGPHGYNGTAALNRTILQSLRADTGLHLQSKEPPTPKQSLLDKLGRFYKPYNEELFKLVGRRLF